MDGPRTIGTYVNLRMEAPRAIGTYVNSRMDLPRAIGTYVYLRMDLPRAIGTYVNLRTDSLLLLLTLAIWTPRAASSGWGPPHDGLKNVLKEL